MRWTRGAGEGEIDLPGEGGLREGGDKGSTNNRSANNGQDPVIHKRDPKGTFILGHLSVPGAHSPRTSRTAEDKGDGKEYLAKSLCWLLTGDVPLGSLQKRAWQRMDPAPGMSWQC